MTHPSISISRTSIVKRVTRTIKRHAMLVPGDRVLAAVSGGADSTALVHILYALAPALRIQVAVAHLNHGLRGKASEDDARFVQSMAHRLELTFHLACIRMDPSLSSLEERGRRERYAFLHQLAEKQGYTKIALGHHMDDNAEAVLMHLLRGSGIRGLGGIPPVRNGLIVRPLIDMERTEITNFLQKHHIEHVEDASNADLRFDRNRIRHHLIPLLKDVYNTNVVPALHRTAGLCWQEDRWLQNHLSPMLNETLISIDPDCMALDIARLSAAPLAVQRRLIRDGLRKWHGHLKRINAGHIDSLIKLLRPQSVGKRICLPNRIGVDRTPSHLHFTIRPGRGFSPDFSPRNYIYQVPVPGNHPLIMDIPEADCRLRFSCQAFPKREYTDGMGKDLIWFDLEQLTFPLTIRNFRPGDRMQPSGMQGRQKIKKIFGDRKIPAAQRHRIPLLISANDILWVVGLRRGARANPRHGIKSALKVEVLNLPES